MKTVIKLLKAFKNYFDAHHLSDNNLRQFKSKLSKVNVLAFLMACTYQIKLMAGPTPEPTMSPTECYESVRKEMVKKGVMHDNLCVNYDEKGFSLAIIGKSYKLSGYTKGDFKPYSCSGIDNYSATNKPPIDKTIFNKFAFLFSKVKKEAEKANKLNEIKFTVEGFADGVTNKQVDFDQLILNSNPPTGFEKNHCNDWTSLNTTQRKEFSTRRNQQLALTRANNLADILANALQENKSSWTITQQTSPKLENGEAMCKGYCSSRRGAKASIALPNIEKMIKISKETVKRVRPQFYTTTPTMYRDILKPKAILTLVKDVNAYINSNSSKAVSDFKEIVNNLKFKEFDGSFDQDNRTLAAFEKTKTIVDFEQKNINFFKEFLINSKYYKIPTKAVQKWESILKFTIVLYWFGKSNLPQKLKSFDSDNLYGIKIIGGIVGDVYFKNSSGSQDWESEKYQKDLYTSVGDNSTELFSFLNFRDAYVELFKSSVHNNPNTLITVPNNTTYSELYYSPIYTKEFDTNSQMVNAGFFHSACHTGVTFNIKDKNQAKYRYYARYPFNSLPYKSEQKQSNVFNQVFDDVYIPSIHMNFNTLKHSKTYILKNCSSCNCLKNISDGDALESLLSQSEVYNFIGESKTYQLADATAVGLKMEVIKSAREKIGNNQEKQFPYLSYPISAKSQDCIYSPIVPQAHSAGDGGDTAEKPDVDVPDAGGQVAVCPMLDLVKEIQGDVVNSDAEVTNILNICKYYKDNPEAKFPGDEVNDCINKKQNVCLYLSKKQMSELKISSTEDPKCFVSSASSAFSAEQVDLCRQLPKTTD